jgi:hypothetical protein
MAPIFLTKHRKVPVVGGRIGNITNVEKNSIVVFAAPFGAIFGHNRSGIDHIAVVKVVVVIPVPRN